MNVEQTTCGQNGRTRLGRKTKTILVFATLLALLLSRPLYLIYRHPKNQEFLSNQLDHAVFAKACRTVMENHSSEGPKSFISRWDDDEMSELPDAIRILNPEKIWITTNEVKLVYSQMVWVYGLRAIAKQNNKDNNNGLGVEVSFFKEWTGK
jgi:hypothetical protein